MTFGGWMKRLVLWDFARGSWQYDVVVGLILLFIFATPRGWFRDQPRTPQAASVTILPTERGGSGIWIDPALLEGVPKDQQVAHLNDVLRKRTGQNPRIVRVQEIVDETEQEVRGYLAISKP